jgi:hypothetical protein
MSAVYLGDQDGSTPPPRSRARADGPCTGSRRAVPPDSAHRLHRREVGSWRRLPATSWTLVGPPRGAAGCGAHAPDDRVRGGSGSSRFARRSRGDRGEAPVEDRVVLGAARPKADASSDVLESFGADLRFFLVSAGFGAHDNGSSIPGRSRSRRPGAAKRKIRFALLNGPTRDTGADPAWPTVCRRCSEALRGWQQDRREERPLSSISVAVVLLDRVTVLILRAIALRRGASSSFPVFQPRVRREQGALFGMLPSREPWHRCSPRRPLRAIRLVLVFIASAAEGPAFSLSVILERPSGTRSTGCCAMDG